MSRGKVSLTLLHVIMYVRTRICVCERTLTYSLICLSMYVDETKCGTRSRRRPAWGDNLAGWLKGNRSFRCSADTIGWAQAALWQHWQHRPTTSPDTEVSRRASVKMKAIKHLVFAPRWSSCHNHMTDNVAALVGQGRYRQFWGICFARTCPPSTRTRYIEREAFTLSFITKLKDDVLENQHYAHCIASASNECFRTEFQPALWNYECLRAEFQPALCGCEWMTRSYWVLGRVFPWVQSVRSSSQRE